MKKIKTAVIGLGMISGGHIQAYQDNPNSELIAVCDKDAEWLSYIKDKLNVPYAYTDYHELLKNQEVELVSICLPTYLHAQASIDSLNAGKHTLCEKPMALSAEEGRAMRDAELKSGKKLMISHNQRFGEDIQVLKKLADQKAFGDIYHVRLAWRRPLGMMPGPLTQRENGAIYDRNWFNEKDKGGGVLRDLGSHLLDLTMHILDFPALVSASASSYRKFYPPVADPEQYVFDSEDLVSGFIKLENNISIQLEVSFGSPIESEVLITNIYGTRLGAHRSAGRVRLVHVKDDDSFTAEEADLASYNTKPFMHPAHGFINCVLHDTSVPVPSDEGLKVLEILDALYASCGM